MKLEKLDHCGKLLLFFIVTPFVSIEGAQPIQYCCAFDEDACSWPTSEWKWSQDVKPDWNKAKIQPFDHPSNYIWTQENSLQYIQSVKITGITNEDSISIDYYNNNQKDTIVIYFIEEGSATPSLLSRTTENGKWVEQFSIPCASRSKCCSATQQCNGVIQLAAQTQSKTQLIAVDNVQVNKGCEEKPTTTSVQSTEMSTIAPMTSTVPLSSTDITIPDSTTASTEPQTTGTTIQSSTSEPLTESTTVSSTLEPQTGTTIPSSSAGPQTGTTDASSTLQPQTGTSIPTSTPEPLTVTTTVKSTSQPQTVTTIPSSTPEPNTTQSTNSPQTSATTKSSTVSTSMKTTITTTETVESTTNEPSTSTPITTTSTAKYTTGHTTSSITNTTLTTPTATTPTPDHNMIILAVILATACVLSVAMIVLAIIQCACRYKKRKYQQQLPNWHTKSR